MKKATLFIIITIILHLNFFASNIAPIQDSATSNYINKNYEQALYFYDSITKLGYSSAEIYSNIANCHYNLGSIANSIYYYEKANILAPNDNDISHNLKIAQKSVKTKTEPTPEPFYTKWFNSILSITNTDTWLIISLTSFILFLSSTAIYLFSKFLNRRKYGFYLGAILLIISIVSGIFSKIQANRITNNKYAIVFESSVIKSSPSEEGTNLFEISEGMKVEVKDQLQDWSDIKLNDGKEGWIKTENIKHL